MKKSEERRKEKKGINDEEWRAAIACPAGQTLPPVEDYTEAPL